MASEINFGRIANSFFKWVIIVNIPIWYVLYKVTGWSFFWYGAVAGIVALCF